VSLGTAAVLGFAGGWLRRERPGMIQSVTRLAAMGVGMVIPPAAMALYFARQGAFWIMYYCVIQHNLVPGLKRWGNIHLDQWYFPLSIPLMAAYCWLIFRQTKDTRLAIRRALILLTPWIYVFLLLSYWPDITREDDLPYVPLTPLSVIPLLELAGALLKSGQWRRRFWTYGLPIFGLCNLAFTCHFHNLRNNDLQTTTRDIGDVLELTGPGDYVMDDKGDFVYRRRAYYWVLEPITKARVRMGLIRDNIPRDMIGKGVKLSSLVLGRPGSLAEQFIIGNYMPFDPRTRYLGVLGKVIGRGPAEGTYTFEVAIPQTYAVVAEKGQLAGEMDGRPYTGAVWLKEGRHEFQRTAGEGRVAIFLNDAYAKGYSPLFDTAEEILKVFGTPEPGKKGAELQ
ncbi:MAG: hypothetical protein ABSE62_05400, partial [Chthoniobacteraceae bacterium]